MRPSTYALAVVLIAGAAVHAQTPPARPPVRTSPVLIDANVPASAIPGLPRRSLLTASTIIDGKREQLNMVTEIEFGPQKQMIVEAGWDMLRAYDSTGKRLWSYPLRRQSEIGYVSAMGWQGSQVWVFDPRYSQVALIDHGTVTKSLEVPTWIRPTLGNRKAYPVFGRAAVLALYADGSMIVVPSNPHSLLGVAEYDSTLTYVLRVDENGIIQTRITTFPSREAAMRNRWAESARGHESGEAWLLASDFWPHFRISGDGARVVTATTDTSVASTDSVVVKSFTDRGRLLWTRSFGVPRRSYSQAHIDSIARTRFGRGDVESRARQIRGIPRKLPTVHDVIVGRDYSVWVTLTNTGAVRPVVGLDANGQVIATVYVPQTFAVRAADTGALWIVDDRWSSKSIVRYALMPSR